MLDNTANQLYNFSTKHWVEINDDMHMERLTPIVMLNLKLHF